MGVLSPTSLTVNIEGIASKARPGESDYLILLCTKMVSAPDKTEGTTAFASQPVKQIYYTTWRPGIYLIQSASRLYQKAGKCKLPLYNRTN